MEIAKYPVILIFMFLVLLLSILMVSAVDQYCIKESQEYVDKQDSTWPFGTYFGSTTSVGDSPQSSTSTSSEYVSPPWYAVDAGASSSVRLYTLKTIYSTVCKIGQKRCGGPRGCPGYETCMVFSSGGCGWDPGHCASDYKCFEFGTGFDTTIGCGPERCTVPSVSDKTGYTGDSNTKYYAYEEPAEISSTEGQYYGETGVEIGSATEKSGEEQKTEEVYTDSTIAGSLGASYAGISTQSGSAVRVVSQTPSKISVLIVILTLLVIIGLYFYIRNE